MPTDPATPATQEGKVSWRKERRDRRWEGGGTEPCICVYRPEKSAQECDRVAWTVLGRLCVCRRWTITDGRNLEKRISSCRNRSKMQYHIHSPPSIWLWIQLLCTFLLSSNNSEACYLCVLPPSNFKSLQVRLLMRYILQKIQQSGRIKMLKVLCSLDTQNERILLCIICFADPLIKWNQNLLLFSHPCCKFLTICVPYYYPYQIIKLSITGKNNDPIFREGVE